MERNFIFLFIIISPVIVKGKLVRFSPNSILDDIHPTIPPTDDAAKMARYIVHFTDWCTVSHISLEPHKFQFPTSRVFSMSDGPVSNSTGTPYIYAPLIDSDVRDIVKDNRCSMTMTLAENNYCKENNWDAEDPRCPQVTLVGMCSSLENDTAEWKFAKDALFTRHPIMKTWPQNHGWLVIKLNIYHITLVDYFGGNKYPSVADYYKANPVQGMVSKSNINEEIIEIDINL